MNPETITLFEANKRTMRIAVPVVGARLLNSIIGFIAMLLIARLGHPELAAGALVTSVALLLQVTVWTMMYSV